jgi:DNA excision repair protein ERCC-5
MSQADIDAVAGELHAQRDLEETRRRGTEQDRITSDLEADCKELFGLMGIPWVESPGEAEAQCAELERLGLVDGVISNDSDTFLFGARRVYRGLLEGGSVRCLILTVLWL